MIVIRTRALVFGGMAGALARCMRRNTKRKSDHRPEASRPSLIPISFLHHLARDPNWTKFLDNHRNATGGLAHQPGNWVFDMQVLLSEMQNSCSRCKIFASRVAKPECQTTIFTGRPAVFASRVAKPECRTTIFTGRPDRLLFYYFSIFTIFTVFTMFTIFTILLFHFHSVPGRSFLHLG